MEKLEVRSHGHSNYFVGAVARNSRYLCHDGVVKLWCSYNGGDKECNKDTVYYTSEELAEKALAIYNGEVVMTKKQLKTGMKVVTRNGNTWVVMLGTPSGDILVLSHVDGFVYLDSYEDNLLNSLQDKTDIKYDIVEVYDVHSSIGMIGKITGDVLWTRPVPETVMTISEIEKVLGIQNLKIKGDGRC